MIEMFHRYSYKYIYSYKSHNQSSYYLYSSAIISHFCPLSKGMPQRTSALSLQLPSSSHILLKASRMDVTCVRYYKIIYLFNSYLFFKRDNPSLHTSQGSLTNMFDNFSINVRNFLRKISKNSFSFNNT